MKKINAFYKKNLIKLILRKNKFLGKLGLIPEKMSTYCGIEDLLNNLSCSQIDIQLYQKDEKDKEFIFDVVKLLGENGIKVELTEFDKIFDNKDLESIKKINSDAIIDIKYVYPNYWGGINVGTKMDIKFYSEIMDKVKHLVKVSEANFSQKDEQVMFIINQLSEYVEYDFDIDNRNREEKNEISSLKGCLQDRKTVCAGVALAFERCMSEMGVECMLVTGYVGEKDKDRLTGIDNNHVWNKIKLGEEWYNVDVTYILPIPNSKVTKDERAEMFILASDKKLEQRGHFITDFEGVPISNTDYQGKMKIYEKTKDIGNVLEEYDKGKRTTFLSYRNIVDKKDNIQTVQKENDNNLQNPDIESR